MGKQLHFRADATQPMIEGAKELANAVGATMGPMGQTVILYRIGTTPQATKDGATVAKEITYGDQLRDMGASIVKTAALRTADVAGDGTTTATVLAYQLISEGMHRIGLGIKPIHMKRGMELAARRAIGHIKDIAHQVQDGTDDVYNIARISANNDEEIGKLIAEIITRTGRSGIVAVEVSNTLETTIDVVDGMRLGRGYMSAAFITDPHKQIAELVAPIIMLANTKVVTLESIMPTIEMCMQKQRPLLIIANEMESELMAALILNKAKGVLPCAVIKTPGFGDMRKEILTDIAALVGGNFIAPELGVDFDMVMLGQAEKVIITKEHTTIIGGAGSKETLKHQQAVIQHQIDNATKDYEQQFHRERLASLSGGIGIIKVGAATELEMREKKDRIDDSLQATYAALEEGVVPGGGVIYARLAATLRSELADPACSIDPSLRHGLEVMASALEWPAKVILSNAECKTELVLAKVLEGEDWFGYDVYNDKYGHMGQAGVIDPAKVARVAIENAVSAATVFVTTACAIIDEPVKK